MPEIGVWATDSTKSSKSSYYEEITGSQQYSSAYVPKLGSSDSLS
jgi:hypothetical protein